MLGITKPRNSSKENKIIQVLNTQTEYLVEEVLKCDDCVIDYIYNLST